jgi:hypothetical protein
MEPPVPDFKDKIIEDLEARLKITKSNEDYEQKKREELEARIAKTMAALKDVRWQERTDVKLMQYLRGEGT